MTTTAHVAAMMDAVADEPEKKELAASS